MKIPVHLDFIYLFDQNAFCYSSEKSAFYARNWEAALLNNWKERQRAIKYS